MALVADTGPILASLDPDDPDHSACVRLLTDAAEPVILPAPILVELEYMLRRFGVAEAFRNLLDDVDAGAYETEDLLASDYRRVKALLAEYADLRLGFVDAAVFAVVERLGEPKLATLDYRHFAALRPRHVDALELLPA